MAPSEQSMTDGKGVAEVVIVDWDDLVRPFPCDNVLIDERMNRIQSAIERAFGLKDGIGLLAVRGVPGFVKAKDAFLPMAHTLATQLPDSYREEHLSDPASLYNAGWSFGKERLGHDKPPDFAKGSFYYNPVTDVPGTEEDRIKYPYSYPCNKWPDEHRIPLFQENAKTIGLILRDVALEVAKHLDKFVQSKCFLHSDSKMVSLYHNLKNTDKVKARLLYYFPLVSESTKFAPDSMGRSNAMPSDAEDSWIGWHNDSGFLTALAGDIYVSHATGERIAEDGVDPCAGLYVIDRTSSSQQGILHVPIPYDCCAVQLGECSQIITGGILVATPHCVRGCNSALYPDVARISLPCFVDTYPAFPLAKPKGISRQQVLEADAYSHDRVPPLALRWKTGDVEDETEHDSAANPTITFGEFLQETFQTYYTWEPSRIHVVDGINL